MPATPVDLYLRKSTKDDGRSVARQLTELTEATGDLTKTGGEPLAIGRVFADPDSSASRYRRRDRPDFGALLDHIRAGLCRVLGIYEPSRGSRDLTEWSGLLDLCRKQRVRIWVLTHERIYDLSRRRDWRTLAEEAIDAADESEKISERVRSGKRKAARGGKPPGRLPYGFVRTYNEKGQFVAQVAHPQQAKVVQEMVRRVVGGEALHAIAADLNSRGITMGGGAPWKPSCIRQTVLRPAYAGRLVFHGEDIGPAVWEPIVDVEQWRAATAILTDPDRRSNTRGTALVHWLTNAVLCGGCRAAKLGTRIPSSKSATVRRYVCRGCGHVGVAGRRLEEFVEGMILARLSAPDGLEVFHRRADTSADDAAASINAKISDLRTRLDEHYAEAAAGRLSARGLSMVEGRILDDIRLLGASRPARQPRLAAVTNIDPQFVVAQWSTFPPATKRKYVVTLADLVLAPATRRGPGMDATRLGGSRWVGDLRTWGEIWAAEGLV